MGKGFLDQQMNMPLLASEKVINQRRACLTGSRSRDHHISLAGSIYMVTGAPLLSTPVPLPGT